MSYMIRCPHCTFEHRVQSEVVAGLTRNRHEAETVCDEQCIIDELGIEDRVRRADIEL